MIELGFILNPYDQCVENKVINGKQCNFISHMDDLYKSHNGKHHNDFNKK